MRVPFGVWPGWDFGGGERWWNMVRNATGVRRGGGARWRDGAVRRAARWAVVGAGQRECGAEVGARRRGGGGGRGGVWWNAAERDGTRRRGAGVAWRMRRLGATHGVGVEGGNQWDVDGMRRARQRVRVGSGALGRRSRAPGGLRRRGGGRAPGRSCYGLVFEVEEFLKRSVECYGEGEGELGGGGELPRLDA